MSRYRGERGNVAPLAVALCLVLVMTLGFLADCAVLYGAKARQEQALDAARSACMDAGQAASAKYGDDAGAVLADLIVDQVRAQGVEGAVSVWFYEAPARAVAESERMWVVGMQVEEAKALPFAVSSAPDAKVASSRVFSARPYAAQQVWRPDARICGVYRFGDGCGAGQDRFSAISALEGFPREIAEEAQARLGG